jgi:hypothetical protein
MRRTRPTRGALAPKEKKIITLNDNNNDINDNST